MQQAFASSFAALALLTSSAMASTCSFTTSTGMAATAPSIPVTFSIPVSFQSKDSAGATTYVAWDSLNCQQLCCETAGCTAVTFDNVGGICSLKGVATASLGLTTSQNVNTYTLSTRAGLAAIPSYSPSTCNAKKGIAAHLSQAQRAAFSNSTVWYYDWDSTSPPSPGPGVLDMEYVPLAWNNMTILNESSWATSSPKPKYLALFNEPNFHTQANMEPENAAAAWPRYQAIAKKYGMGIVSPAMNYCGPAAVCTDTDPLRWLSNVLKLCGSACEMDYVSFHAYGCSVAELNVQVQQYYSTFQKPLYVSEFACPDPNVDQIKFMSDAVQYLELNPHVVRYAWYGESDPNGFVVSKNQLFTTAAGSDLSPIGIAYRDIYASLQRGCNATGNSTSSTVGRNSTTAINATTVIMPVKPAARRTSLRARLNNLVL